MVEDAGMTRMNKIIHFTSENLTLEGMLSLPKQSTSGPGALICHPHPQYGGDMDNNVVLAVANALEQLDMTVLRFNFRGVNGSEGTFDNGSGEVNDVLAALLFLTTQAAVDGNRILLVGYSFGAFVGLQAALRSDKVKVLAAISTPVDMYDFEFLSYSTLPILVVCGDRDSYCSLDKLERVYRGITAAKEKVIVPGADHFYWGKEDAPAEAILRFTRKYCY